jgi:uncharacterized cupredoxin-like copper-binding protein
MARRTAGSVAVAAVVGAALAVTGATGATGAGAAATVKLKADAGGALKFNKRKLTAAPGKTTIRMKNPGSSMLDHGIEVEGNGVEKEGKVVAPGGTSKVTLKLKPGKYEYYCPVPGHKQAGMKGKLTVK